MKSLLYPPSIDWELTPVCNHKCVYCYNFWRGLDNSSRNTPSSTYYDSIADRIIQSHPVSVQITGGEPLIVWPQAKRAVQSLLDAGINVSINTNATLVDDEIAAFLADNNMDAFVSFPCSDRKVFDEIVHCEGAAVRADKGIRLLLAHGVRVSLNMVVTRINFPFVYDTAIYVKKTYNVPYFSATKASFPQNAVSSFRKQMLNRDEFNEMLSILLKVKQETGMRVDSAWVYSMCGFRDWEILEQFGFHRKCGCGRYSFVVDANGGMKACGCDSKVYGNILEESFSTAISRMNEWQNGSLLPMECKTCKKLIVCGGGCRADARSLNQQFCLPDSTANIDNRDKFDIRADYTDYPEDMCFSLHTNTIAMNERDGVRLSNMTNYAFVTKEFWMFLDNRRVFSIRELTDVSGVEEMEVQRCIFKLIKKRILVINKESKKTASIEQKRFSLEYYPYYDESVPTTVLGYIYDNNARYTPM